MGGLASRPLANASAQLDPVLSRRFARQQEKLASGESAVDHVASVASRSSVVVDSALARKLQQQREKEEEEKEREKEKENETEKEQVSKVLCAPPQQVVNTEEQGCKRKKANRSQGITIAVVSMLPLVIGLIGWRLASHFL